MISELWISIYNNRIVNQSRVWLMWAAGGECRLAAGRNRGLGRRRPSQNRDVAPVAWLMRVDGRVQTIPPQSGVTSCLF